MVVFLLNLKNITVLWDFDGTLFDTYPVFTELMQTILPKHITYEEIYSQLKISFSHAINHFELTEEDLQKFAALLEDYPVERILPFAGVEEVLSSVGKNVIMTHKDRAAVEKILGHHGLRSYFTDIVTIDDGFPRKPNPASYEYLHSRNSINLVIGDRLLDIIPGQKIGAKTCLFQNKEAGADFYLDDYRDFEEKVGQYL